MAGIETHTLRERLRIGGIVAISLLVLAAGVAGYFRHSHQKQANTRKLLRQARDAESANDLETASTFYQLYLKRQPSDAAAQSAYAAVLRNRMKTSNELVGDVLGTLRQLIRLEPDNLSAIEQLVDLYLKLGDFALAEQHAQTWSTHVPGSVEAAMALARARQGLLRYDEAVETLKEALEWAPQEPRLYALLIEMLATKLDRAHEAAEWLAKALRRHPDSHEVHLAAFALHTRQRARETAESHLDRALQLAPEDIQVLIPAALLRITKGRLEQAKSLLDDAEKLAPESSALLAARSKWAIKTNDPDEMAALGHQLVSRAGDMRPTLFARAAELFLRAGKANDADECLQKLITAPRLPGFLYARLDVLRGARALAGDEPYTAIPFLERALARQGPASWAAELLAIAHSRTGAIQTAADIYHQILLSAPNEDQIRLTLAWLEVELGHLTEVQEHTRVLVEVGDGYVRHAKLLRAACELEQVAATGQRDTLSTTTAELTNLVAAQPQDETATRLLAQSIVLLGQPGRAIQMLLESPVTDNAKARLGGELGYILLDNGFNEIAEGLADELIRRFPEAAAGHEVYVHLHGSTDRLEDSAKYINATPLADHLKGRLWEVASQAQLRSGQKEAALESLRRAISLKPTNVRTRQALVRRTPDLTEARRILDQIRTIEGDEGLTWRFERAWLLLQRDRSAGRVEEAAELLRRCLTVRPGWISARLLLGFANEVIGDFDDAADAYRSAIAQQPELSDSQAAIRLVRVLRRLGDYVEADNLLATIADVVDGEPDLLRLKTAQHLRRKNLASAAATAEQLLSLRGDDPAWAALTVELLLRAGNLAEAERIARSALDDHPEATTTLWAYARVLVRRGRAEEAEALIGDIATRQQRASYFLLLAQLLTRLEKHQEAEQAILQAVQLEPDNASVCTACAHFWGARGEFSKQLAFVRKAIELRGEDPGESLTLAQLLSTSDSAAHRPEAAAIVDRRLQADQEDLSALLLRARLDTTANPPDCVEAEKTLMRALAIDPRSPEAHKLLAAAQIRSGRLNLAGDTVSEGLAFAPKDPDLLLASAQIHCHQGNYHRAITPLRWLLEVRPRSSTAIRLLATAYQHTGRIDRAIRMIEGLAREEDWSPTEIIVLAKLHELRGDIDQADSLFNRALVQQPKSSDVFQEHLHYHARHGALDEVYALASQRRLEVPEDIESILTAGELLAANSMDRRLREVGTTWLEQIARDHPDRAVDATYRNALCHYHRGELTNAETLLQEAMRIAPTSPRSVNALAWLYSEDRDDPNKALQLIEQFLDKDDQDSAELLDTHGTILLRLNRLDEAEKKLRTCLEIAGQTPTLTVASYHLGLVLLKKDERGEARVYFRRALELNERLGNLSETERQHARELTLRRREP